MLVAYVEHAIKSTLKKPSGHYYRVFASLKRYSIVRFSYNVDPRVHNNTII